MITFFNKCHLLSGQSHSSSYSLERSRFGPVRRQSRVRSSTQMHQLLTQGSCHCPKHLGPGLQGADGHKVVCRGRGQAEALERMLNRGLGAGGVVSAWHSQGRAWPVVAVIVPGRRGKQSHSHEASEPREQGCAAGGPRWERCGGMHTGGSQSASPGAACRVVRQRFLCDTGGWQPCPATRSAQQPACK